MDKTKDAKTLNDEREAKAKAASALIDLAATENREMNEKESAEFRKLSEEVEVLGKQLNAALDAEEELRRKNDERAHIEAEARLKERFAASQRAKDVFRMRATEEAAKATGEIRVHDHFPMGGREARAFSAVHGDEKRGRHEAYKSGMWVLGNVFGNEECRQWSKDYGYGSEARALNNVVPSAGGVLVPDGLVNAIIWNVEQRGIFAQYANTVPMGQNDIVFVPKSTGEVTVYAVAENQTDEVTESEPTMDGIELIARTWGSLIRVGRNLIDDAVISIGEHVAQKVGYATADKQDQCGFNGTGTSAYHNIRGLTVKIDDGTHTASVNDAIAGNTTFGTLDMDDFEACVGKLPQWADSDDVAWYISKPGFYASMAKLMDAAGGNTQDNVAGGKNLQFLGYPVRITQVLNRTLGANTSQVVALFGSLRKTAAFGQKKQLEIQTLTEKYATYNQVGMLGFSRWGINNHELGDNTNAGAMIALKTAGS